EAQWQKRSERKRQEIIQEEEQRHVPPRPAPGMGWHGNDRRDHRQNQAGGWPAERPPDVSRCWQCRFIRIHGCAQEPPEADADLRIPGLTSSLAVSKLMPEFRQIVERCRSQRRDNRLPSAHME